MLGRIRRKPATPPRCSGGAVVESDRIERGPAVRSATRIHQQLHLPNPRHEQTQVGHRVAPGRSTGRDRRFGRRSVAVIGHLPITTIVALATGCPDASWT